MNKKLHITFLYLVFPGVVLAWSILILPFHIWDSISEDWFPEFKDDMKQYLDGVKNKRKEIG